MSGGTGDRPERTWMGMSILGVVLTNVRQRLRDYRRGQREGQWLTQVRGVCRSHVMHATCGCSMTRSDTAPSTNSRNATVAPITGHQQS